MSGLDQFIIFGTLGFLLGSLLHTRYRLARLERCVFSEQTLNGKRTALECRCTGEHLPP